MRYIPETRVGKPHEDLVRPGLADGDATPDPDVRVMARILNHGRLLYPGNHRSHID